MSLIMLLFSLLLCEQCPELFLSAATLPEDWQDSVSPETLARQHTDQSRYDTNKFEGDIITNSFSEAGEIPPNAFANAETDENLFWPNNTIPYQFATEQWTRFHLEGQKKIVDAMGVMMHLTGQCVQFVQRKAEGDYVLFHKGQRSYSDIGRKGGEQSISLSLYCIEDHGCIQHEIMHALGFYHEQSRMDRDQYVFINEDNIAEADKRQFETYKGHTYDLPYDEESIMHYEPDAFAKDKLLPTIISHRQVTLGQKENLSPLDVVRIHRRFKCKVPAAKGFIQEKVGVCSKDVCEKATPRPMQSSTMGHEPRDSTSRFPQNVNPDSTEPENVGEPFPQFSNEPMTPEQCAAQNTTSCRSFGYCPNFKGLEISCSSEPVVKDISRITLLMSTPPLRPVRAVLQDGPLLKFSNFEPIRKQIISFTLKMCVDDTGTSRPAELGFLHLWEFQLGSCHKLVIKREHFKYTRKLRVIILTYSTITTLEIGAFSDLPDLRLFAPENSLNGYTNIPEVHREYSNRMHCSCDLAWFRRWWNGNRQLLRKAEAGEIFQIPGSFASSAYVQEDVYLPIDCSKPFPRNASGMKFPSNQTTFSLNEQCEK